MRLKHRRMEALRALTRYDVQHASVHGAERGVVVVIQQRIQSVTAAL